MLNVFDMEKV